MSKGEFDLEEYFSTIFGEAGFSEDEVKALKEKLAHEKVVPKIKETVMMRSDYSRRQDQISTREQELSKKEKETEEYYKGLIAADHNNRAAWDKLQTKLREYETGKDFGLNDTGDPEMTVNTPKNVITKEDFEQTLARLQEDALTLNAVTTSLALEHYKEFGEPLDVNNLYKHARENRLSAKAAYQEMVAGRREELRKTSEEERVKKAREEGYQDALSKHKIPVPDESPQRPHPVFNKDPDMADPAKRKAALTELMAKTGGTFF